MAKIITTEQIKNIKDTIFQLNIPVQTYVSLDKLFTDLPDVKEEVIKK